MSKKQNDNFNLNRNQAASIFTACTVTNLMDAFLRRKFGEEYTTFMEETAQHWIKVREDEKEAEARASEAQTTTEES